MNGVKDGQYNLTEPKINLHISKMYNFAFTNFSFEQKTDLKRSKQSIGESKRANFYLFII